MSPGLLRARAPFRIQNAITGLVLAGFATAVWAYSIRAVKQDDFSDVDDEAREMLQGRVRTGAGEDADVSGGGGNPSSSLDVNDLGLGLGAGVSRPDSTTGGDPPSPSRPRGVLAPVLDRAFPRLLDPTRKTLVWGAPPLNDLGRVSLRSSKE